MRNQGSRLLLRPVRLLKGRHGRRLVENGRGGARVLARAPALKVSLPEGERTGLWGFAFPKGGGEKTKWAYQERNLTLVFKYLILSVCESALRSLPVVI